jgi:hypothetical protein
MVQTAFQWKRFLLLQPPEVMGAKVCFGGNGSLAGATTNSK